MNSHDATACLYVSAAKVSVCVSNKFAQEYHLRSDFYQLLVGLCVSAVSLLRNTI